MVDLGFAIEGVEVERFAAVPTLVFKLHVRSNAPEVKIQNVLVQCQIRIEAQRRRYVAGEQERLSDLFGESHRWSQTLRSLLWTHTSLQVPGFETERTVDMPIACSFDFNVAATKYFHGLEDGQVPLTFLFSGTVFYREPGGTLQMDQIAWSAEATYPLPVGVWQQMMDLHYPDGAWLRLSRDIFDRVEQHRRDNGFTNWEQSLAALLDRQSREPAS